MKPHFIKRHNNPLHASFSIKWNKLRHFIRLWTYHPEIELVYIIKGKGTRFVGDSIASIDEGELILLGDNLPHKWQNDPKYFDPESTLSTEAIVIHFLPDFMGSAIQDVAEFQHIRRLLERAHRGIYFQGHAKKIVPSMMQQLLEKEDAYERMISLINILNILAQEASFQLLTSIGYNDQPMNKDSRMNRVHNFIMNNFHNSISLEEVATLANMNKSAFSRYFKQTNGKNFIQYLNEIRIGFACKLLLDQDEKPINEICYESGYNNLSNFNQQFKKITSLSPSQYIKKYRKGSLEMHQEFGVKNEKLGMKN